MTKNDTNPSTNQRDTAEQARSASGHATAFSNATTEATSPLSEATLPPTGQRLEAYRTLFCGPSGQQVLLDLLDRYGFLSRPTLGADPQMTAYHEGQRSVVMAILRNAGVAPQVFPQVVSDHVTNQYRLFYGGPGRAE